MSVPQSIQTQWAKEVILAHFKNRAPIFPDGIKILEKRAACFVSLHNSDGSLRGCIGTILPVHKSLIEEIRNNALSAAFSDPRFKPLGKHELKDLDISVDVLDEPEPVYGRELLDPKIYGVIVSAEGKRGVLLPDLDGIDTVDSQLYIAMQKAGIKIGAPIEVQRFKVVRYH